MHARRVEARDEDVLVAPLGSTASPKLVVASYQPVAQMSPPLPAVSESTISWPGPSRSRAGHVGPDQHLLRCQRMFDIKLSLPDEALVALKRTPDQMAEEIRMAAAMKLYELGRLSSGAAAALAGVPRVVFLAKLADYGIPTFKMSAEDLAEDLARA
jgi:predicted HTH domain antitoxin